MSTERRLTMAQRFRQQTHERSAAVRLHISERRLLLLAGDLGAISLALLIALCLRYTDHTGEYGLAWPDGRLIWWLVLWMTWTPVAMVINLYDLKQAGEVARSLVYGAFCAILVSAIYLVIPIYAAPLTRSRLGWFLFSALAVVGVMLWRLTYARLITQPTFNRRVIIVGAGQSGRQLAREFRRHSHASSATLVGLLDQCQDLHGQLIEEIPVLGDASRLPQLVERLSIDDVVVAITDPSTIRPDLMSALVACWSQGVNVVPMATYYEEMAGAVPVECIGQNLFVLVAPVHMFQRVWGCLRRIIDILVGIIGLVLCAPFLPLIALAIVVDCPGPVFYRQERVGKNGQSFYLTKFRSMIPKAENGRAVWAKENDDRITRVGRIMRKMRIDELPQFWNLVDGTMTLIGPRPERPEFVQELALKIPYYTVRHAIKPGITGWAQVKYHYGNTVEDAQTKLEYDLYYLKHRGPVLDTLIALHTIRVMLRMEGS